MHGAPPRALGRRPLGDGRRHAGAGYLFLPIAVVAGLSFNRAVEPALVRLQRVHHWRTGSTRAASQDMCDAV